MTHIFSSIKEAFGSVIPIALIVLVLSVTCIPLDSGVPFPQKKRIRYNFSPTP